MEKHLILLIAVAAACSSPQATDHPAASAPAPTDQASSAPPEEPAAEVALVSVDETEAAPPEAVEQAPPPVAAGEARAALPERRISWAPPADLAVALYRAPGVSMEAHLATLEALRAARGFRAEIVDPEQVRAGALDRFHVVVFTGGRGGEQGQALGEDGRQRVRDFVAAGGGYVGVCAGSYLAMQGPEEFFKLAIVAARNLTGDAWRRGTHTLVVREVGSERLHHLFYANGPVFEPIPHETLPQVQPLATFVSDAYLPAHGTNRGEMPGTPAILASSYGHGRIVLFSPNPVLAAEGEAAEPELMLQALRWVATVGAVPEALTFGDVFR